MEGIIRPQGGHVTRHFRRTFAVEHRIVSVLRIGVAVGCGDVNIGVHRRLRLQLKAAGADLAGLDAERLVSRISRQVLVFGQLIDRRGDHHRHIFRHVFHAGFILLTARRIERLAAAVGTRYRFKRFAVAEVRRDAVIEQVVDAAAPAELLVVILRQAVGGAG